jgi:hypothetical protein
VTKVAGAVSFEHQRGFRYLEFMLKLVQGQNLHNRWAVGDHVRMTAYHKIESLYSFQECHTVPGTQELPTKYLPRLWGLIDAVCRNVVVKGKVLGYGAIEQTGEDGSAIQYVHVEFRLPNKHRYTEFVSESALR